jgi:hypothetical protein
MTSMALSIYHILCVFVLTVSFMISGGFEPVHAERGHGYERDRYYFPIGNWISGTGTNTTTRPGAISCRDCLPGIWI